MHSQACSCIFILLNVKCISLAEVGLIYFFFQWNLIQRIPYYLVFLFIFPLSGACARKVWEQSENSESKINVL